MDATTDLRAGPDWPHAIQDELTRNSRNGCVGQRLVSESGRVRVWSIRLKPGERIGFHRHVLDHFWTALTDDRARSRFGDGTTRETTYRDGDTRHMTCAQGEFMVRDLENTGGTELVFTTVEFLDSANRPMNVPESARRA